MLVQVIRTDHHFDYIKDFMLDSLIKSNAIVKFKRITGWVTIGSDPIRIKRRDGVTATTDRRAVR
jgi:hypothetical protein